MTKDMRFSNMFQLLIQGADFSFPSIPNMNFCISEEGDLCHLCSDGEPELYLEGIDAVINACDTSWSLASGVDMVDVMDNAVFYGKSAIAFTTNGSVTSAGSAIMGKGIAKKIKDMCPGIENVLSGHLKRHGNVPGVLGTYSFKYNTADLISLPSKHNWQNISDCTLIMHSLEKLIEMADERGYETVFLNVPGIGCGGLSYSVDIEPLLANMLDERFTAFMK